MEDHLSVQRRIKLIAQQFKGCNYVFMNWAQLNEFLDDVRKPTICYILPPSGVINTRRGGTQFKDKPLTMIAFLAPTDFDFDGERNDDIIELMKLLAFMFIKSMNESGLFEMLDDVDIEYKVAYDTTDDNVTGIIVKLPIEETPQLMCDMPATFGFVKEL